MNPLFQNMGGKYDQWYTSRVTEGDALRFPLPFKTLESIESTEMVTLEAFFILFPSFSLWQIWPRYEDAELRHYGWPARHHAPILDADDASSGRSFFGHQTEQHKHQREPGRDKSGSGRFEVQHEPTWSSEETRYLNFEWNRTNQAIRNLWSAIPIFASISKSCHANFVLFDGPVEKQWIL